MINEELCRELVAMRAEDVRVRQELLESGELGEPRRTVGLGPLHAIPEPGPELPLEEERKIVENQQWWKDWLTSKGWRRRP